jgi:hypothetical protein
MSDWQITFNGLTIGDATYGIEQLTGFHDSPEVRTSDQIRARSHGQWSSPDFLGGRTVQASITINSQHPSSAAWQALSQALVTGQQSESVLSATIPGVAYGNTVQVNARVRKLSLPIDMNYTFGVGRAEVEWHCTDPRIYSSTLTTLTTTQATSSGGLLLPALAPLAFIGTATGGQVVATNSGEFDAPWTAVISGPVTNPRIENVTTGETISFTGELGEGDTLTISSLDRTVLLNNTTSRYSWLTAGSSWFDLPAGDTTVRFAGASGSGSIDLSFRSVWI